DLHAQMFRDGEDVLVAAPGEINDDDLVSAHLRRALHHLRARVGRLQRRNDAFQPREKLERLQRLIALYGHIFGPAAPLEPGVFRADARIVGPGGNAMPARALPVPVRDKRSAVAVQRAGRARRQPGTVLVAVKTLAAGRHADEGSLLDVTER